MLGQYLSIGHDHLMLLLSHLSLTKSPERGAAEEEEEEEEEEEFVSGVCSCKCDSTDKAIAMSHLTRKKATLPVLLVLCCCEHTRFRDQEEYGTKVFTLQ
jgi:hypothetical protein